MSRAWFIYKLRGDLQLTNLVPPAQIIAAGGMGLPGTPVVEQPKPFIIIRAATTGKSLTGGDGVHNYEFWEIWVHDNPGSYERIIGPALRRIRTICEGVQTQNLPDGGYLSWVEWLGDSADLLDDGFNTATRFTTFRCVVRR